MCMNNMLWHNQTSADRRPSLRPSVAVAEFTAFNTPAGRFIAHPWGHHKHHKPIRKVTFVYAAVAAGVANERVMDRVLQNIADRHLIAIPGLLSDKNGTDSVYTRQIYYGKAKIFNFGLPRTGTTSFFKFMIGQGFDCRHTNHGFIDFIVQPSEYGA